MSFWHVLSVIDFGVAKEKSTAQGEQDDLWNSCSQQHHVDTVTFKEGVSYYKDEKNGKRNSNQ